MMNILQKLKSKMILRFYKNLIVFLKSIIFQAYTELKKKLKNLFKHKKNYLKKNLNEKIFK